jgi:hypothetical protein
VFFAAKKRGAGENPAGNEKQTLTKILTVLWAVSPTNGIRTAEKTGCGRQTTKRTIVRRVRTTVLCCKGGFLWV